MDDKPVILSDLESNPSDTPPAYINSSANDDTNDGDGTVIGADRPDDSESPAELGTNSVPETDPEE